MTVKTFNPVIRIYREVKPFAVITPQAEIGWFELHQSLSQGISHFSDTIEQVVKTGLPHGLLMVSRFLSDPLVMQSLVQQIVANETALNHTKDNSYYHQNGFDKLVLLSGKNFKVRLHHFHASNKAIPMENIHDHRWAFASTVIQGGFDMLVYHEDESGEESRMLYTYYSNKQSGKYETELLGQARLKETARLQVDAGQSYIMAPDNLHSIVHRPGQEAVTLIVTGRNERDTCKLFARDTIQEEQKLTIPYSTDWLTRKLFSLAGLSTRVAC